MLSLDFLNQCQIRGCLHHPWGGVCTQFGGVLKKIFSLRELTPLPLSYTPHFPNPRNIPADRPSRLAAYRHTDNANFASVHSLVICVICVQLDCFQWTFCMALIGRNSFYLSWWEKAGEMLFSVACVCLLLHQQGYSRCHTTFRTSLVRSWTSRVSPRH